MADLIARLFVLGLLVGYTVLFIALAVWTIRHNRKPSRRASGSRGSSLSLTPREDETERDGPNRAK
jgi:hypothetical protein